MIRKPRWTGLIDNVLREEVGVSGNRAGLVLDHADGANDGRLRYRYWLGVKRACVWRRFTSVDRKMHGRTAVLS